MDHEWPAEPEQHVWTKWMSKKFNPPESLEYRTCVHPGCSAFEERVAPRA